MATEMKNERGFLEPQRESGSHYRLNFDKYSKSVDLTLFDCYRSINWDFGPARGPKSRGAKKIAKIKKFVDKIYDYYHSEG